jgi:hypothetical protein
MKLAQQLRDERVAAELRRRDGREVVVVHGDDLSNAQRAAWPALLGEAVHDDVPMVARDGRDILLRVQGMEPSR